MLEEGGVGEEGGRVGEGREGVGRERVGRDGWSGGRV